MEVTMSPYGEPVTFCLATADDAEIFNAFLLASSQKTRRRESECDLVDTLPLIIQMMVGRPAGRVLSLLAEAWNRTLKDDQIRTEYGSKVNIGAAMCHVTQCCKKYGRPSTDVVEVKKRGVGAKKVVTYTLTDEAQRIVRSLPELGVLGDDYLDCVGE